jgi:uncharacterized protein (DUF433 family)
MTDNLTEKEIDRLVVSQADDPDAWEQPIQVDRKPVFFLDLPLAFEIDSDKDVLSGTPVFRGTNVPVSSLLENLESGVSLDEFIKSFPSVKREQAVRILELFKRSLSQLKAA